MKKEKKSDENKISVEEKKRSLVQDFEHNAARLKRIPSEIEHVKKELDLTLEDLDLKMKKIDLQVKDLEVRRNHFRVVDAKYDWESLPEWLDLQKDLINIEIESLKFVKRLHERHKLQAKSNSEMQVRQLEEQRDRCQKYHKVALNQLRKECNFSETEINDLKKKCTSPCCR